MAKKSYKKRGGRRPKYSKAKKMVTGHGPTMLEQIASGVGSVAKLASAVAPAIAAINTESKYFDGGASTTSYNPGTNDSLIALSAGIAEGTNDSQRIGNSILAKDLSLRLAMNFNSTIGTPNVQGIHCRATLVCWKADHSADPCTVAKVFEQPNNLYSPVNKDRSDSFVVMKDKYFSLNNTSGLAGVCAFTTMKIYKKLDWHMRFNGPNAYTSATQNHLFLILRSSASGVGNALSCTHYARINYTDN